MSKRVPQSTSAVSEAVAAGTKASRKLGSSAVQALRGTNFGRLFR